MISPIRNPLNGGDRPVTGMVARDPEGMPFVGIPIDAPVPPTTAEAGHGVSVFSAARRLIRIDCYSAAERS